MCVGSSCIRAQDPGRPGAAGSMPALRRRGSEEYYGVGFDRGRAAEARHALRRFNKPTREWPASFFLSNGISSVVFDLGRLYGVAAIAGSPGTRRLR